MIGNLILFFLTFVLGGVLEIHLLYNWSKVISKKVGKRAAYYLGYVIMYVGFLPFFAMNLVVVKSWINIEYTFPVWTEAVALLVFFIGLLLNYFGIKTIKLYRWNSQPKFGMKDEDKVIKEKIYSRLRHPTYLGQVLIFYAVVLYFPNFYTLMIAIVYHLYMVFIHAKLEEKKLLTIYGDDYKVYMDEVRGFIPIRKV